MPGIRPVTVKMIDAETKALTETIYPDAVMVCTGRKPYSEGLGLEAAGVHVNRGFVQVNEKIQALDEAGSPIDGLWCIGDLNGKMMLAHAASAQGISAVEIEVQRRPPVSCWRPNCSCQAIWTERGLDLWLALQGKRQGFHTSGFSQEHERFRATTTTTLLNPCSGIRGVWSCAVRGGAYVPLPGLAAALKAGVRKPTRTPDNRAPISSD